MFKNIKEYKGIKVRIRRGILKKNNKRILADYSKFKKLITIYEPFYKQSTIEQKAALEHERGHHVFYKMPIIIRRIWQLISNGKLINIINIFGITKYTENAFARKYGEKNYKEDFSTCIGEIKRQEIKGKRKFNNFADDKIKMVRSMYNFYKNK